MLSPEHQAVNVHVGAQKRTAGTHKPDRGRLNKAARPAWLWSCAEAIISVQRVV